MLFDKEGVGLRIPGWLGILAGYCFDALTTVTGKKLPISSIRVKKFMATTSFNTSVSELGFTPSSTLDEAIRHTVRHEFLEDHSSDKEFYTE